MLDWVPFGVRRYQAIDQQDRHLRLSGYRVTTGSQCLLLAQTNEVLCIPLAATRKFPMLPPDGTRRYQSEIK